MNAYLRHIVTVLMAFAVVGVSTPVWAQQPYPSEYDAYQGTEHIASFDVSVVVDETGKARIQEEIEYDFGTYERRGIFRVIPQVYERNGARYHLWFSDIEVMQDGTPAEYEQTREGNNLRIKIGNPDIYLKGKHLYTISYTTERAWNTFEQDTIAEWYWNVTGDQWNVPIKASSFTIRTPFEQQKATCFTGRYGSRESYCEQSTSTQDLVMMTTQPLSAYEGLTVVVQYPNTFTKLPWTKTAFFFFIDQIWLGLPLLSGLVMWCLWWLKGRDPKGRGVVITEYEEPEGLRPAALAALVEDRVSSKAITATILDLARRGHLTVLYKDGVKEPFLVKQHTSESLQGAEKALINGIFSSADTVSTGGSITDLHRAVFRIEQEIMKDLQQEGYYTKQPARVRALWYVIAIIVPIVYVVLLMSSLGDLVILGAVLSSVIMMCFAHVMPRVTRKGALLRERVLGFKRFLSVTEEKRLAFTDAPEKRPEEFARFLPAAVAFGVEKAWAKQFENMTLPPPDYVRGVSTFHASDFVKRANAMNSALASSYMPPSSAGSGSSGFSGGGSGGGFGGGGGGSW